VRTTSAAAPPPPVFQLAGHPLRWRLMSELARGDRRVRELTASLQQPQSLVSYHLRRLRAGELVSARRSSFDSRDTYYSLDLARCRQLLAEAGAALHPPRPLRPADPTRPSARTRRARVLFLCTGNSARSQIAEALAERLSGGRVEALSAGSRPKPLHPNAVRVMRERGIDLGGRRSKHLDELADGRFDYVVTLCDRVREVCPELPGQPEQIHWSIPDPASAGATDAETYPAFERVADELATRVPFLLERIEHDRSAQEVTDG
jgi:protein-tyrosine-phosphatase/DNA-binding transcriptional ArsR family regulator